LPGRAGLLLIALVVGVAACSVAGASLGHRHASAPGDLAVSPTGSDAAPCTLSEPCASFDRAYQLAQPGQHVEILAGTYPAQTLHRDSSKADAKRRVVFAPATGQTASVSGPLQILGSHVEFDGITTAAWSVTNPPNGATAANQPVDVVMRDVTTSTFGIFGASNVQVLGGSVGPAVNTPSNIAGCFNCTYAPSNILVSGVSFHDYTRTSPSVHMECLHVWPATELRIVRNRFRNCAIMDVFLSNYGKGGDLKDVTVENNVFDAPGSIAGGLSKGFYSLVIGPFGRTASNISIDYNSFLAGPNFSPNAHYSDVRVSSNVGPFSQYSCKYGGPGITYSNNVWGGAKCSASDIKSPPDFVNPAGFDLTLKPGAPALAHGSRKGHPSIDIDGKVRPKVIAPDAGAFQSETAVMTLGTSIGATQLGSDRATVVALHGDPVKTKSYGSLTLESYRVPSGRLLVLYQNGVAVGLGTTSAYYSTPAGYGVRSRIGFARSERWVACQHSYALNKGGTLVYVRPTGARKKGKKVGAIWMVRGTVDKCGIPWR
jgi:hypothetical protein